MKILFVTLEESAKQNLISILDNNFFKKNINKINIYGLELNNHSFKNVTNINIKPIMGITAIFKNLPYLFKLRSNLNTTINDNLYSHIFFIDSFDFTKFYLQKYKTKKIKYCQIIGPSVYIWKKNKAIFINKNIDKIFSIFKIEHKFYNPKIYNYIGHPLLNKTIRNNKNFNKPKKIGFFLGSRLQEIVKNHKIIKELILKINKYGKYQLHLFVTVEFEKFIKKQFNKFNNIKFHLNDRNYYKNISHLDFAFACSGTVHLELSFSNIPHFIFYKANYINFFIFKYFVKSKYLSLLNIFSKNMIVKEFIQKDFNSHNLFEQFKILISDSKYLVNYNDKIQRALNYNKFENLNIELIIDYLKKSSLTIKD